MKNIQEEEISEENVIELKLLLGGKQPPKQGNNWLNERKQWCVFLAKNPKLSNVDLFLFRVREKYGNSTCLEVYFAAEPMQIRYFSNVDFSNEYILMDILEEENDSSNRTDLNRRLEVDVNIKENNTVVTETRPEEFP